MCVMRSLSRTFFFGGGYSRTQTACVLNNLIGLLIARDHNCLNNTIKCDEEVRGRQD